MSSKRLLFAPVLLAFAACGSPSLPQKRSTTDAVVRKAGQPFRFPPPPPVPPHPAGEVPEGPRELQNGYHVDSPDSRYRLRDFVTVEERATGRTFPAKSGYGGLFSVQWTPDSKAFRAVGHVAGGKLVWVTRRTATGWETSELEPPHYVNGVEPLQIVPDGDTLHCKFQTSGQIHNGEPGPDYLTTFDYDIPTGRKSHVVSRRMSEGEYVKNRWRYNL